METSSDVPALQARLDHILGRTPLRQKTEEWVIWMLLSRMETANFPEAAFQSYRAARAGRRGTDNGINSLAVAANCGHAEAIRIQARLVLDEVRPGFDAWLAANNLIWLDSRTNAEGTLLAGMMARTQWAPLDRSTIIEQREKRIAERCGPRVVQRTLGRAG